jgi:hypothetical protein
MPSVMIGSGYVGSVSRGWDSVLHITRADKLAAKIDALEDQITARKRTAGILEFSRDLPGLVATANIAPCTASAATRSARRARHHQEQSRA